MAQGFAWMALAEAVEVSARLGVSEATPSEPGHSRVPPVLGLDSDTASEAAFAAVACRSEFSWDCSWAIATVLCESGFAPRAHGHEWYRGVYYHFLGWWQIAVTTHEGNDWLYDMYANTVEAHLKYAASGTAPWPVCGH